MVLCYYLNTATFPSIEIFVSVDKFGWKMAYNDALVEPFIAFRRTNSESDIDKRRNSSSFTFYFNLQSIHGECMYLKLALTAGYE